MPLVHLLEFDVQVLHLRQLHHSFRALLLQIRGSFHYKSQQVLHSAVMKSN